MRSGAPQKQNGADPAPTRATWVGYTVRGLNGVIDGHTFTVSVRETGLQTKSSSAYEIAVLTPSVT